MAVNANTTRYEAESAASKWLVRRTRGLTADEKSAFAVWLGSPVNAEAFRRAEVLWNTIPQLSQLPSAEIFSLTEPRRRRLAPIVWLATGIAASAAVAFFVLRMEPVAISAPAVVVRTHVAPDDAESRFVLPDGSIALLHRGSRVSYGGFAGSRQVRLLTGEAHFTVAKTSSLPFFVRAGQVTIRDIGTAFDVRLDPERVAVLVTEGKVEVRNGAESSRNASGDLPEPVLLTKGQQAVVETAGATVELQMPTPPEVEQTLAWKSRRLSFNRTPLAEAVAELNRYNARQLTIADPSIATVLIAGGVQSDNLDAFVRVLESNFGVSARIRGNEILLSKAP